MASSSVQSPAAGATPIELQPMRRPTANGAVSAENATQGSESSSSESQGNQSGQTGKTNSLWSRKLFNVHLSLTRILSLLGLLLALIFGTGAWVGMEYANKYAKGSYQIAMYELCLSEKLIEEPVCKATLSKGVDSLVIRDEPAHPFGVASGVNTRGRHRLQYLPALLKTGRSLNREFNSNYFAAWAFHDMASGLALSAVDETLRAASIASSVPELARTSRDAWASNDDMFRDMFSNLIKSAGRIPFRDLLKLTGEWRLRNLNAMLNLTFVVTASERADEAVRYLLVAEEHLIRLESGSSLPALYTLSAAPKTSLNATIRELVNQVEDGRGIPLTNQILTVFVRFAIPVIAFDLGVFSLLLSNLVDFAAPSLAAQPELSMFAIVVVFGCVCYFAPLRPPPADGISIGLEPRNTALMAYWVSWFVVYWISSIRRMEPLQAFAGPEAERFCKFILHNGTIVQTFLPTLFSLCLVNGGLVLLHRLKDILRGKPLRDFQDMNHNHQPRVVLGLELIVSTLLLGISHDWMNDNPPFAEFRIQSEVLFFVVALAAITMLAINLIFAGRHADVRFLGRLVFYSFFLVDHWMVTPELRRCSRRFSMSYQSSKLWFAGGTALFAIFRPFLMAVMRLSLGFFRGTASASGNR